MQTEKEAVKIDMLSLEFEELERYLKELKCPSYRAKQIFTWLHRDMAVSFDEMSNIPKALREQLADNYYISRPKIQKKFVSDIDETVKYLYNLKDGESVETVVMKYKHGLSICISTQVGCKMGCNFCASTLAGYCRNLTPGEMLSQIYEARRNLGVKISSIVLMGIGEPLDNYDNVLKFLKLMSDKNGQNMSHRHISLSTCGLIDEILKLSEQKLQITLSISLHAPTDELRDKLMPINKKHGIDKLLAACTTYLDRTHRRISFEYIMLGGVNDTPMSAKILAGKLKGMLCHVNLIPVNRVDEWGQNGSSKEDTERFKDILEKHGITVTVRRRMGADIEAACGQLRRNTEGRQENF